MRYKLFIPKQAVGASLVYFDLFNPASSQCWVDVESVVPVVSGEVAVTGVVAVDLFLTRTTAIGTGGTEAVAEGTSLTVPAFVATDHAQPINHITARLTPTGGATAGAVLASRSVYTEETNAGAYTPAADMVPVGVVTIPSGKGIRVVQGGVASVGNIGFDVTFNVRLLS